jgi:hypothetical protein
MLARNQSQGYGALLEHKDEHRSQSQTDILAHGTDQRIDSRHLRFRIGSQAKRHLLSKPDLISDPTLSFENTRQIPTKPARLYRAGVNSMYEPVSRRARGGFNPENIVGEP